MQQFFSILKKQNKQLSIFQTKNKKQLKYYDFISFYDLISLNVKLSNSQLNVLKSAIKNGTEVTLNLS